jgi:ribosomal protein S18 acetylase RimI-like enzyme
MIHELPRPLLEADLRGLADVLIDAADSGASVSFLPPLSFERAQAWWRDTVASADARAAIIVARDEHGIAGTVQLHPAWAPNQPHRAEIAKLLVHRRARRRGLGRALMDYAESHARRAGFTLLTLDTKRGDAAEALYEHTGWQRAGVIPGYAQDADGSLCDTVIFYKDLRAAGAR